MKAFVAVAIFALSASANPNSPPTGGPELLEIYFQTKDKTVKQVIVDRWVMVQQFANFPALVVENPKLKFEPNEKGKIALVFHAMGQFKLTIGDQEIVRPVPILHLVELEVEGNYLDFLIFRNVIVFLPSKTPFQNLTLAMEYYHPGFDREKSGTVEVIMAKDDDKEKSINELAAMLDKRIPRARGTKKPLKPGEQVLLEPADSASGIVTVKMGKGDRVWEVRQKRPFLIHFNLPINSSSPPPGPPKPLKIPEKLKGPIARAQ